MAFGMGNRNTAGTTANGSGLSGFGPAFWAVLLADFASWIILLAGVASVQQWVAGGGTSETAIGSRAANNETAWGLTLQWWNMVLQLVVLLAIAHTAMWRGLAASRVALSTLLAIITVLLILDCNAYNHQRYNGDEVLRRRRTVYFAGALLCSLFNFLMILVLGHHHATNAVASDAPLQHKGPDMGTGTTTAARTEPAIV